MTTNDLDDYLTEQRAKKAKWQKAWREKNLDKRREYEREYQRAKRKKNNATKTSKSKQKEV